MIEEPEKQLAIVASREHLVLEEGQLTTSVASFIEEWLIAQMRGKSGKAEPKVVLIDADKLPEEKKEAVERLKQLAGTFSAS
jgi:hypothetical protein